MADVFLGLGSNKGDREGNIENALSQLKNYGSLRKVSSLYETEPVGYLRQQWFLNCVVKLKTGLTPSELMMAIKSIEKSLGKRIVRKNGPRTIDIDILLFGIKRIKTKEMEVPHPRFHERAFVLVPFAEIAPRSIHPVLGKTILKMLKSLDTQKKVRKYA